MENSRRRADQGLKHKENDAPHSVLRTQEVGSKPGQPSPIALLSGPARGHHTPRLPDATGQNGF